MDDNLINFHKICFYYRLIERCESIVRTKDESRAKIENENSSTDEIDDYDDVESEIRPSGIENGHSTSSENNEENLKGTCQSNGVQENLESMKCESSSKENVDPTNGYEDVQNSEIHSEAATPLNSECKDKIDISVT